MDKNKRHNRSSSRYTKDSRTRGSSTGEEGFYSSSPFFRSLRALVRRGTGTGDDGADNSTAIFCSGAASVKKPASFTCLSPEVLGRLRLVGDASADEKRQQSEGPPATGAATVETPAREENDALIGEDGRIEWSLVKIAAGGDASEGDEDSLAEGARLAVVCHAELQRKQQQQLLQQQRSSPPSPPPPPPPPPQEEENERLQTLTTLAVRAGRHPDERAMLELPFAEALPGVIERIVGTESKDEEIYVALCICLTILERALYDIYRQGTSNIRRKTKNVGGEHGAGVNEAPEGNSEGSEQPEDVGEGCASVVAPAMIMRDLIATPEIKSALPKQMVAVLRLLLLPMGFNIRNLVVRSCSYQ